MTNVDAVGSDLRFFGALFGWFGKNWTARTEYLYVDLGNATDTFSNSGFTQTLSSNYHSHIFRTSLVYKFGGP